MRYLTLAFFMLSTLLCAQKDFGETITTESKIMGETRELQIILPENFNPNQKSYSVIYVTDGERRTTITKSITDFMKYAKMTSDVVIVGIINVDRNRDFTPTKMEKRYPTSGGADTFIKYLEEEVKPFVVKNYGKNNKHILTGHSFGGLFSMYTFLTNPTLFDAYVSSDPSFWWDDQFLNKLAKEKLPNLKGEQHVLFINGRDGIPFERMGIAGMKSVLEEYAPASLDWKLTSYPNETHTSVLLKGYYDGLRFVEEDYLNNNISFHPKNVQLVKDKPVILFLLSNENGVHYTTNGKEPTKIDATYKEPVVISEPGIFKYKKPSKRASNKVHEIPIKLSNPIQPEKKLTSKLKNGLVYTFYEGDYKDLSQLNQKRPTKKGITTTAFGLKDFDSDFYFICEYNGYYKVEKSGYHYFIVKGGEQIQVELANQLLLDYDSKRDNYIESSAVLYLEKGFHPISIKYLQKDSRKISLKRYVPNLGMEDTAKIPFEVLYHQ